MKEKFTETPPSAINMATIIQSVLTSIAIVIGGIWAYYEFSFKREDRPRLNVSLASSSHAILKSQTYLRTTLTLENMGHSRISISKGFLRIYVLDPVHPTFMAALNADSRRKILRHNRIQFPAICSESLKVKLFIEPKERSEYYFELFIPAYVKLTRMYAYLQNGATTKNGEAFGWEASHIHKVAKNENPDVEKYQARAFDLPILCTLPK